MFFLLTILSQTVVAQINYTRNLTVDIKVSDDVSGSTYSSEADLQFKKFTFEIIVIGVWLVLFSYILDKKEKILSDFKPVNKLTLDKVIFVVWVVFTLIVIRYVVFLYNNISFNF